MGLYPPLEMCIRDSDVVMPGGPPVIAQILKGLEEGRVTRKEMETAVGHLLSMVGRLGRFLG